MNIETELKKDGIEVVEKLDTQLIQYIAQKVSNKICQTFPNFGLEENELYAKISNINMYKATMPEGMSEANYFYKNSSIYFNSSIPDEELEEFAIHECIHYIQEVKDKRGNLVKMGLSDYSESKPSGIGINEAAVQLMASKVIGTNKEYVKYFNISFETISPSYYPLECCLVGQLAYIMGENTLYESTINSNDKFKNKFIEDTSIKTYLCVKNAIDTILDYEEKIIKLNNKIFELNDGEDKRCSNMSQKINEIKNEILLTFLKTQNQIISSYFNNQIKKIKNLEEIDIYRRKLYNLKDYLGSTDGYTFYHDFYVEKMAELEHMNNVFENGGTETALSLNKKDSFFAIIIKKIKALFKKKEEIEEK